MIFLSNPDYLQVYQKFGGNPKKIFLPRGFTVNGEIYINQDAFFLNDQDYKLLINHEIKHTKIPNHSPSLKEKILGIDHTFFGLMSPWSIVRYLTTFKQEK